MKFLSNFKNFEMNSKNRIIKNLLVFYVAFLLMFSASNGLTSVQSVWLIFFCYLIFSFVYSLSVIQDSSPWCKYWNYITDYYVLCTNPIIYCFSNYLYWISRIQTNNGVDWIRIYALYCFKCIRKIFPYDSR